MSVRVYKCMSRGWLSSASRQPHRISARLLLRDVVGAIAYFSLPNYTTQRVLILNHNSCGHGKFWEPYSLTVIAFSMYNYYHVKADSLS